MIGVSVNCEENFFVMRFNDNRSESFWIGADAAITPSIAFG